MLEDLLAKSNLGIKLVDHMKDVINVSMFLFDDGYIADYYPNRDDMRRCLALSAMFHDIGKCTEKEQMVLRNESAGWDERVGHNLVGEKFLLDYVDYRNRGSYNELCHIAKMVRFHHIPIPMKDVDENSIITESDYRTMRMFAVDMRDYLIGAFCIDFDMAFKNYKLDPYTPKLSPITQFYELIDPLSDSKDQNGETDELLSWMVVLRILAKADRLVSHLYETADADTLRAITNNDRSVIESVVRASENVFGYNPNENLRGKEGIDMVRYEKQEKIIKDVEFYFNKGIKTCIIEEYPGFGKTLCGLLLSARYNGSVIWCAPTQALAEQTYNSLVKFMEDFGIHYTIGLFFSGKQQKGDDDPKISVCVIDTYLAREKQNGNMVDFLETSKSLLILDEYQEFECSEALFAAFFRLMYTRMLITGGNTVLISATPLTVGRQELLCQGLLGEDAPRFVREICKPASVNPEDYPDYGNENGYVREYPNKHLSFSIHEVESYSDVVQYITNDSITITSTVKDCQEISKLSDSICVHARFTKADKESKFDELKKLYGKESSVASENKTSVVMSPIGGTGLDISCKTMNVFITKPSDIIQFQGRLGRFFAEEDSAVYNLNLLYFKEKSKDGRSSSCKLTNSGFKAITNNFISHLEKLNGREIVFKDLCDAYNDFIVNVANKSLTDVYKAHMLCAIKKLSNISFSRSRSNMKDKENVTLSSSQNFRGEGNQVYATSEMFGGQVIELETEAFHENDLASCIDVRGTYKKFKEVLDKYVLKNTFNSSGDVITNIDNVWSFAKRDDTPVVLDASKHSYSYKYGLSLKR